MFKAALEMSLSAAYSTFRAYTIARDYGTTPGEAREARIRAQRLRDAAYKARMAAAVAAVEAGVPLAHKEGQCGGVVVLPWADTITLPSSDYPHGRRAWHESIYMLNNGVSARGLFRQVRGYRPTWEELEDFVQEVTAPRTPPRQGRALRGCPIAADMAAG